MLRTVSSPRVSVERKERLLRRYHSVVPSILKSVYLIQVYRGQTNHCHRSVLTDFYLFVSSQDSLDVHKNNSSSDFWFQIPKTYSLERQRSCALKQVSFSCDFKPKTRRLYLCSDIVEKSYVRNTLLPVVRNIEIYNKSRKYLTETFEEGVYLPVNITHLTSVRVYLWDSDLKPVEFDSNDLHSLLHFKKNGLH